MNKIRKYLTISAILGCLLLLNGCAAILPFFEKEEIERISSLAGDDILVETSQIRPQIITLISQAQKAVYIQLSSLDDQDILNLLVNKSKSGVEVRILLDQWQRENAATVKLLKNQNISVQYYPAEKGQYQRVRYLVVDYQTAVFFSQDWTAKGFKTYNLAIKLTDDTAWNIAKSFAKDWTYTTTLTLELPDLADMPDDNNLFTQNSGVKQQILGAINSATSEIKIMVEQLSDPDTVAALVEAKKRGCHIQVILSPSTAVATPNTIKEFQANQIEIKFFNHPAKLPVGSNIAVFDDKALVMTSSSWTYYSFVINHEAALVAPSPEAAGRFNAIFKQHWQQGTPI